MLHYVAKLGFISDTAILWPEKLQKYSPMLLAPDDRLEMIDFPNVASYTIYSNN